MKIYKYLFFLLTFTFLSCISDEKSKSQDLTLTTIDIDSLNKKNEDHILKSKKKMDERGIVFESLGDCDNSISEKNTTDLIITKQSITKSTLNVDFKFLQACCQTFGGDYKIKNDTLIFEYKNVGGICKCECWYRYKLRIRDIKDKFTSYKLIQK